MHSLTSAELCARYSSNRASRRYFSAVRTAAATVSRFLFNVFSYVLQSWVIKILYELCDIENNASLLQLSLVKRTHCFWAALNSATPSNVDISVPVDENIELVSLDQISSKSVEKSKSKIPNEFDEPEYDDEDDFPDNKSPMASNALAAALVSFLIANSPTVGEYIASTSAAVLSTAFKLLSWNCCNIIIAWSKEFSISRNFVKRLLQKHRRYVSLAFAHIWSIHVAYDSRHSA